MKLRICIVVTAVLSALSGHTAFAQKVLPVVLVGKNIPAGETRKIDIEDDVCEKHVGIFALTRNESLTIGICRAHTSCGNIRYRVLESGNESWTQARQLSPYDELIL